MEFKRTTTIVIATIAISLTSCLVGCDKDEPIIPTPEDPIENPADNPNQYPAEDPNQDPSDDPNQDPSDDPNQNPSDDPNQNPSDDPNQDPADDPNQNPVETRDPRLIGKWQYFWSYMGNSSETEEAYIEFFEDGTFKELHESQRSADTGSYWYRWLLTGTWSTNNGKITRKTVLKKVKDYIYDSKEIESTADYEISDSGFALYLPGNQCFYQGEIKTMNTHDYESVSKFYEDF